MSSLIVFKVKHLTGKLQIATVLEKGKVSENSPDRYQSNCVGFCIMLQPSDKCMKYLEYAVTAHLSKRNTESKPTVYQSD